MKNTTSINILIVDDHPLNVDAYKKLISDNLKSIELEFIIAETATDATKKISRYKSLNTEIHYAFIDYNIPEDFENNIYNGIDLASFIKKAFLNSKIIFITMHNEPTIIGNIINTINPIGVISKSDVSFKTFKEITRTIFIENQNYRSKSVVVAESILFKNNLTWDEYDFKILELLSKGEKTNNLPLFIPLGLSAIEKRKATIKKQLLLNGGNDKDLITEARKRGLI